MTSPAATSTDATTDAFVVEIDQNRYLPAGSGRVDAIVTVTAPHAPVAASDAPGLEIIILDRSGSMTGERIMAARLACAEAISQIRDGVGFAVIAGAARAEQVYPEVGTAVADDRVRADAIAVVERLRAGGGTAMGAWLTMAGEIADRHPGSLRHAILLTDGKNDEQAEVLRSALDAVVGRFTCDCRGVGTDWEVEELRQVSTTLLGSVDIVADPADLAADFREMMRAAMGKTAADISLRLWTPRTAKVLFVKQVAPTIENLTTRRTEVDNRRGDYPLGSWGAESREYHVCVELEPGVVGEQAVAAARTVVVRGDAGGTEELGRGVVLAEWTEDTALSTPISRGVALYTDQAELAVAIQEGLAAQRTGDVLTATTRLGRAVALAHETGNDATALLLAKVVDVTDAPMGTVRLRADASKADSMRLDSGSTITVQSRGRS